MASTSLMYFPPQGFTVSNRSLSGSPNNASTQVRFKMLGSIEVTLVLSFFGNEIVWYVMEGLRIPWGDNSELLYETCQPGWKYEWNVDTAVFTVMDSNGQATIHEGISTISDLKISWDVFNSGQFHIYKTITETISDGSIIAQRMDSERPTEMKDLYWMDIDYLTGVQHAVYDFLSGYFPESPGLISVTTAFFSDGSESRLNDILLADIDKLIFNNAYPLDLLSIDNPVATSRTANQYTGYMHTMVFLMIMYFAERLLSADAKIVYEPWMLYSMFQWLFQQPHHSTKEPIFDLSPWWG